MDTFSRWILKYPTLLNYHHNCYPLAPERLTIDKSMFSPLQMKFPDYKKKPTVKLASNLKDKTNCVVHYRNLTFYLEQELN